MRHTLFLACLGTSISVAAISNADAQEKNPTNTLDMLTTAVGLAIALPSVVMAYLFQQFASRQINRFSMLLNRQSLAYEVQGDGPLGMSRSHLERAAE